MLAAFPGAAQERTLRLSTTNSPKIHVNRIILHPWAKRLTEEGKGILKIDVRDGPVFANARNYFERAKSNVSQIGWGVQAVLGGKFVKGSVVGLPFISDKSEYASVAYWRLIQSELLDSEYQDTVPLFVNVFPQSDVHLNKKPDRLDDLSGLKIISSERTAAAMLRLLGAAPLSLPLPAHYEAIQRGTAHGNLMMYTAFAPFKLAEVTSFHIDTKFGTAAGWVFMMRKVFNGLTREQQALIMKHSGEKQTLAFGQFWDTVEASGRKIVSGNPKHEIVELPPETAAKWKALADKVTADWVKNVPDGAKILARYKAEIEIARAGK